MTATSEAIARICHEANRALQTAFGDPHPSPAWEDAPDWQRTAALDGVRQAVRGETPERRHDVWCTTKTDTGWVWGPVKDAVARTHPALVPYAALPADQKARDHLFVAIVEALS